MSTPIIQAPIGVSHGLIGLLVIHFIAISTTVFRLGYRLRRHQLQWDDFWAFVAMLCDIVNTVMYILLCLVDLRHTSLVTQSFTLWSTVIFTPVEIWATRLSIAVTVVRILPAGKLRQISIAGCWAFVFLWVAVEIQEIFICGFPIPAVPYCISKSAPIVFIICNIIGSLWLVCWPAYVLISMRFQLLMVTNVKLPSTHHRLLLACFSTSTLLLVVNISHDVYLFGNDIDALIKLTITGHIEVALSLILCNVLVLVTYLYRLFVPSVNATRGSNNTPHSSTLSSTASGRKHRLFRHDDTQPAETQVYTSTQIYTLTEYPAGSGEIVGRKERRGSTDTNSISSEPRKPPELSPCADGDMKV